MKRRFVLVVFFLIIAFAFKPTFIEKKHPLLLPSYKLENQSNVQLSENALTTKENINASFEKIHYSNDKFSDDLGFRPFPWGKEVFEGNPNFKVDSNVARSGNWSFQITSTSPDNVGALAVPGFEHKPLVEEGELYYLSFWIRYEFQEGKGIRVLHQFFIEGDYLYPTFASYGPFITGTSNGEWEKIGLLVKAPRGAIRGDPVILMAGEGKVNIDDAYFGKVD